MNPIEKLICDFFSGNAAATAKAVGVTPPSIHEWKKSGKAPVERCVQLEKISHGKISRKQFYGVGWQKIWPELAEERKEDER
ncbi:transcriptional regulator [Neisseria weixii]|uniref:transcriptional regulator n=1 Tax=Neisseria weixii TaxID=1853276 RepID=UPI00359FA60C